MTDRQQSVGRSKVHPIHRKDNPAGPKNDIARTNSCQNTGLTGLACGATEDALAAPDRRAPAPSHPRTGRSFLLAPVKIWLEDKDAVLSPLCDCHELLYAR